MPLTRQDAWTQDEDLMLAEVVLRHIREGGTQLRAFEEVGRNLSRTAAACGFRWNSYVRKQYKSGIELAKKQRKELKKQAKINESQNDAEQEKLISQAAVKAPIAERQSETILDFRDIIKYLEDLYENFSQLSFKAKNIDEYEDKTRELEKQIYYLSAENEKLEKNLEMIKSDYQSLIEIMERARKMVILREDNRHERAQFQMEKNGNLEKIER
ncbi:RsfA family transcriptional regulator [Mesobacillus harenae]|uniref:RsfA family transcriptional regulator n=1 Tax=Mesobacillus harenae TaxID=2213203 RepID=UPI0015812EEF|nr:RsfA family transcriptional regulator [Mesobacillus harenae]